MRFLILLIFLNCASLLKAQSLSSTEVIEKSIAFHDPESKWESFKDSLFLAQITPEGIHSSRIVFIDRMTDVFAYIFEKEDGNVELYMSGNLIEYQWNNIKSIPKEISEKYRLTPERAELYKNYYLYLYGMPMKILDPGAIIDPKVERVSFYGMNVLKIKVNYQPEVGEDVWYFYFDPTNFELKAYQFFHDEALNDGEYILFEGLSTIGGIKMPKTRSWYTNKEKKLLGIDRLN